MILIQLLALSSIAIVVTAGIHFLFDNDTEE